MKTHHKKLTGLTASVFTLCLGAASATAQSTSSPNQTSPAGQAERPRATTMTSSNARQNSRSADELIGRSVVTSDGQRLGEIRDLVIDAQNGRVAFAVLSSGGVLGIGGNLRAVPYAALQWSSGQGDVRVNLDRKALENLPDFREDQLATLAGQERQMQRQMQTGAASTTEDTGGTMTATTDRARTSSDVVTDDRSATKWTAEEGPVASGGATPGTATRSRTTASMTSSMPVPSAVSSGRLVLASKLDGRELRGVTQTIGEIEDVLINPDRQSASLLVKVDDAIVDGDNAYVVGFNQLSLSSGADSAITTRLSASDFQGPASLSSTPELSSGRPYAWRSSSDPEEISTATATDDTRVRYSDATANPQNRPTQRTGANGTASSGATAAGTSDETVRFSDATANPQNRPTSASTAARSSNSSGQAASVDAVRQALRNDEELGAAAQLIDVSSQGQAIVLSGTVPTQEVRMRILQAARSAASGQAVEDRLTVRGAAE